MNFYKVTLADGTAIDNLRMNGNNFVSETELSAGIFYDNLDTVTVEHGDEITVMNNVKLIQVRQYGNEWWFVLDEMSELEVTLKEYQEALIELAEMITGR